jgi:Tol biopolymer transport system component
MFSPDGTRIAFVRETDGGEQVMVVGPDGGEPARLSPPLFGLSSAAWTPASDGLVFGHGLDDDLRLELFPLDGSGPRSLLDGAWVDWFEYRPPIGDEVVFRAEIDGQWGLYRMRPDGSEIRPLALAEVSGFPDQDLNFVSWAPDGSRIFYNRYTPEAETIQAWVMDPDGSNQRRFNASGPPCCWWEGEMAPSPDGRWVVMWRQPPAGTAGGGMTLFPADGSGEGRVIGPELVGTGTWRWSPDSTRILVNHNDADEGDQVLVDPVTGEWTAAPWNDDATPDWQRLAP